MTRFMMPRSAALELVPYAFEHGKNGDLFVQKDPAATIEVLATTLKGLLGKEGCPLNGIGPRRGEKFSDLRLSREEMGCAEEM
ncbi:polysaccharide biosynthesis protein, partial [Pseudomonas aeruginosa]